MGPLPEDVRRQRLCFTCVFWDQGVQSLGWCRRYPPPWHQTNENDLCGEHRAPGEEPRQDFWRPASERINARSHLREASKHPF